MALDVLRGLLLGALLVLPVVVPAAASESASPTATAARTEFLWLSGQGQGHTVDWRFRCSAGRRCGEWTTIAVPSQWELEGFGTYNYGHDQDPSAESGRYRHRFSVPEDWRGRAVDLVFEGVMTDAEVWINGRSAGPKHQGAFYRFRHDVGELLRYGDDNELEVLVHKRSSDSSVNRAERDADYWVFGGIYRPVYLSAAPAESIAQVEIDARHDGEMVVEVEPRGLGGEALLRLQVETLDGLPFGPPRNAEVQGSETFRQRLSLPRPRAWSAEFPHLYRLRVDLERDGRLLHRRYETFGFRTFEVRPDGLFVNGRRVLLKGVNRHAFWPSSGRTLNRQLDETDVALIKSMNLNAVRLAHYPPDVSFLDACDRQGLYVLDELAGWHDAYRTPTGRRLARQMVRRDVNHPSILFWDNGNEGGWNPWLDRVLHETDLQRRPVLRPDALASGIDTQHYLSWRELGQKLDPRHWRNRWRALFGELPLVMPTELLHGLYDGGSGAGLEDYWTQLRASPRGAGFFLWAFADEAVVRSDRRGILDADGNHAPDGILGPYREKTGSSAALRQILSPIAIESEPEKTTGGLAFEVENRFHHTALDQCRFAWSWLRWPSPFERAVRKLGGAETAGPSVPPGERGRLVVPPFDTRPAPGRGVPDALKIDAFDPHGRKLRSWIFPQKDRRSRIERWIGASEPGTVEGRQQEDEIVLVAGGFEARFDAEHGGLKKLRRGETVIELGSGPRLSDLLPLHPRRLELSDRGASRALEIDYGTELETVRWELFSSGWLSLDWRYRTTPGRAWNGIGFAVAPEQVAALRWLGDGPDRVWKNRQQGGLVGVWNKAADADDVAGFYREVQWARFELTAGGALIVAFEDDLYLGVSAPGFPDDAEDARAETPPPGLHFLHDIPAIGTKFYPPEELGPSGWPEEEAAVREGKVWFRLITD